MKKIGVLGLFILMFVGVFSFGQADLTQAADSVTGFKLPWPADQKFTVTNLAHSSVDGVPRQSIDFGVYEGTPVLAMKGGDVVWSNDPGGVTNGFAVIDHNDGTCSAYVHLKDLEFGVHTSGRISVAQGQQIGTSGRGGPQQQVHLHIAVYKRTNNRCGGYGDEAKKNEAVIIFDEVAKELAKGDAVISANSGSTQQSKIPAVTQGQPNLPLMYWPMADANRHITSFPNSPWTHRLLGLNPGQGCPPYRIRFTYLEASEKYWRDKALLEAEDIAQARALSRGGSISGQVACYATHEGTDIYDPSGGEKVFAVADGDVVGVAGSSGNQVLTVNHHRVVDGVRYTWRVRYVHLGTVLKSSGSIRQGDALALVGAADQHLHFEVEALSGGPFNGSCVGACIINPWGHGESRVNLWIGGDVPCATDTENCETLSVGGCESPDTTFCDVPLAHPHYEGIEALYAAGIVQGSMREVGGQMRRFFDPDGLLERQHGGAIGGRWLYGYAPSEFASVLPPALGLFPDLTGDAEWDRALEQLHRDGVLNGFSSGEMKPNQTMTRKEFLYMVMRILLKHGALPLTSCIFPDDNGDPMVRWGCDLGVVRGNSAGLFQPDWPISRAEAATIACRAFLTCSATVPNSGIETWRTNAKVGSPAGELCFTASSLANPNAMPGIGVAIDGDEVCYRHSENRYLSRGASAQQYLFRASPSRYDDSFNCNPDGIVSLELRPSTTGDRVSVLVEKCDDERFNQNGVLNVLVDGNLVPGLQKSYTANTSIIEIPFDPVEYGWTGKHEFVGQIQSADAPAGDFKLTNKVVMWGRKAPLTEDYSHEISNDDFVCGDRDIIKTRFKKFRHVVQIDIGKCTGSNDFGQDGFYYVLVDGQRRWGPFYYQAGESRIGVDVDHYGEFGWSPTQNSPLRYQIELFSIDQPTLPKLSHQVSVWTENRSLCHRLNLQSVPANSGGIIADPPPNCGSLYLEGTNVNLTAVPASTNYRFTEWTGSFPSGVPSILTTISGNKSHTANFELQVSCYALTVNQPALAEGLIEVLTPPNCGTNRYLDQTQVLLRAQPKISYVVERWSGAGSGSSETTTILLNQDQMAGIAFREIVMSPPPPIEPNVSVMSDKVELSWSSLSSVNFYEVYRSPASSSVRTLEDPEDDLRELIGTTSGISFTDETLSENGLYLYWVRAVNDAGTSDYSPSTKVVEWSDPNQITQTPGPTVTAAPTQTPTGTVIPIPPTSTPVSPTETPPPPTALDNHLFLPMIVR